ncbi:hypothetical protein PMY35_01025 [Clostridium tertium]|uniref:hypothetical protein n=1 Tax=Clostridium tertium TaxID=1559 RepID=UPI00189FCC20|nr:hypothetical protein [Clostridium tertium]MDB1946388.1 hypothetical protein [Clostridium tertium]
MNKSPEDIIREEVLEQVNNIKAFSLHSCITTAEGVARRVLKEIKEKFNEEDFNECFWNDVNHGGNDYRNLIELGEILKRARDEK